MLQLDGRPLKLDEIKSVADQKVQVSLAPSAIERMAASRRIVESILSSGKSVYGVNTGFGKLSDVSIAKVT